MKHFNFVRRRLLTAALSGTLAFVGIGSACAQGAAEKGGTLIMVVQPEPPTLASYQSTAGPVGQVASKIFEGLLEYDFNLKPIPGLAKSWAVSPDGKTVTFSLQEGVKFHDGKPFTSEDVKFSILDVLKKVHPRGVNTFRAVTDVKTPDPLTAIFELSEPAPYMLMAMSSYESPMLPKHVYGNGNITNHPRANTPVGTGPFKFVEWQRGQVIRLDRNKDYHKAGLPHLDRIVARFIADGGTRAATLETGEAQIAGFSAVLPVDVKRLKTLPHLGVTSKGYEMQSPLIMLDFNTTKPPFDNVKVRQAVAYAIDRKFVLDNIWFGFGRPSTGPISSNFKANGLYTADVMNYDVPNRIEIANKLLDEAGKPRGANGVRFEIVHDLTPYGDEWRRFGEYVQQQLGKLGIKVTLRYEDVPTWLRRIYTNYDFQLNSGWIQTLADPAIGVHRLFHSNMIKPGTVFVNDSRWSSKETDELMTQAAVEVNPEKRAALYHEFQKKVVEASPVAFMLELDFTTVYNKKLHNFLVSPLGLYSSFDQAWLAK
ncbi:ABC transporter substrate-binding protein [Paralcaligenes ureilyticus]|uniref:Peptide/nickel transport system substrate-binding protein n=1 Tax=Paralcaligenes ureilyticus TaxID=627131 RepID=A0A4R3LJY6_9BURK|nr:ABC transporter substrate-binding protein [Paralcaligenes ureilyticus]TCT00533.1 peptide/nickel transport system substrate-binding protein [Paralcaligenes ureilyticus]